MCCRYWYLIWYWVHALIYDTSFALNKICQNRVYYMSFPGPRLGTGPLTVSMVSWLSRMVPGRCVTRRYRDHLQKSLWGGDLDMMIPNLILRTCIDIWHIFCIEQNMPKTGINRSNRWTSASFSHSSSEPFRFVPDSRHNVCVFCEINLTGGQSYISPATGYQ